MRYLIGIVLILFVFSSCTKSKKVIEETYSDGTPKIERYYEGNGSTKEMVKEIKYYKNSQKEMEGEFKNAKRDGYWVYYYENGSKWSEGYFKNGLDEGKRTVYFETGKKRYEGNYSGGVKTGLWKFWNESGLLEKEINYDTVSTK